MTISDHFWARYVTPFPPSPGKKPSWRIKPWSSLIARPDTTVTSKSDSSGRYISVLEDRLDIAGDIFLLHTAEGGYGPEDIVERGQLTRIGTHIDMGNYSTRLCAMSFRRSHWILSPYTSAFIIAR